MTSLQEHDENHLDNVERAITDTALGRPVVIVDDHPESSAGHIAFAAQFATAELVAFAIRHGSGMVCAPMPGSELDRLGLPPMALGGRSPHSTAFAVSVDARENVTTGISASDRARTVRLLAAPDTQASDLARPGHVFPLRAAQDGVLAHPGPAEAAVDLSRLAALTPAGAIAQILDEDGEIARLPDLLAFARRHGLAAVSIADLIAFRRRTELHVERAAVTSLPTEFGDFTAVGYTGTIDKVEHIALLAGHLDTAGRLTDGEDVLVRLHSECLTGDAFGSLRCDCGPQLQASMRQVAESGNGIVLYMRGHEGRGIGLSHKLRAYQLQEQGRDTVDANLDLGLPADARDYSIGAQMLADLGVRSLILLTNNPEKVSAVTEYGLKVSHRMPVAVKASEHNLTYLRTKRDRMGHELPWLEGPEVL
ncbi:bifunctional 3,4-dihydroxy-2-butanone-4-phosphate synthase/GTP cyclohydrolase II (plasmid) [Kitasatospora sp. NBC_00070]|uniref:bifunctional 3,4-dihydroxy-2-butanone-4-phosphate synthase/GTP cyclohydrolase II n=1 Tax=Kitasatospora sp. NBC_00070 TaxID=2975962 RepID=UPI002F9135C2